MLLFLWAAVLMAVCGLGPGAPLAWAGEVPAALSDVGERAEDLYDTLKAEDWSKAAGQLAWFRGGLQRMDVAVKDEVEAKGRLTHSVRGLGEAIAARQRRPAMIEANRITAIVAGMSERYRPAVPVAVAMLDFYGRDLEIWSAAGETTRLGATAAAVRRTWEGLRPEVVARGGGAEAKRFDALVARLGAAKTPAQYGRLATPILDEVDNLERVFAG